MRDSARYVKIVEWSHEDHCYVGSSPGLIYGGCHGDDEKAVFDELCRIVEDAVELYRREGRPLPPPTSGRDFSYFSYRWIETPFRGGGLQKQSVTRFYALAGTVIFSLLMAPIVSSSVVAPLPVR